MHCGPVSIAETATRLPSVSMKNANIAATMPGISMIVSLGPNTFS